MPLFSRLILLALLSIFHFYGAPLSRDLVVVKAVTHDRQGSFHKLRGTASVETTDMLIRADEIDYDQNTGQAEARGNVKIDYYTSGEHLEADRVEYNLELQNGRFYNVRGSSPARLQPRPGMLTSTNPFSFEGKWAERIGDRFLLHEGFITSCKLPRPWWTLGARTFDIVPNERAIGHHSVLRMKNVPLLYTPAFYKPLGKEPRKSGFLTPNIGNSSQRGLMFGWGYYWAMNRSHDLTYRPQLFTGRGLAHNVDFRGRPWRGTDFSYVLFGVNDRGLQKDDGTREDPASGYTMRLTGRADDIGWGFTARGEFNSLSSLRFRRSFTESFHEAVDTAVQSRASLARYWGPYGFSVAAENLDDLGWSTEQTFPQTREDSRLSIRKLPSIGFHSRDRQLNDRILPVWLSFESSAAFLQRYEDAFISDKDANSTRAFVQRYDLEPRLTTAIRWKDIHLIPSFSLRETSYGSTRTADSEWSGPRTLRSSREFSADLILPSLARVFESPAGWVGTRLKHVIEPRASFRTVSGIGTEFHNLIRFDETELLADTTEADIAITNRIYSKRANGRTDEILSWQVAQRRYFDPSFGGALRPGQRNIVMSSVDFTPYAFLDGPRRYSPIVSTLQSHVGPLGMEWRTDYDPMRSRIVNNSISVDARVKTDYFVSAGNTQVNSIPLSLEQNQLKGLSPRTNLLDFRSGYGQRARRGLAADFGLRYSYVESGVKWAQAQITYNTDCCGWSGQYWRNGITGEWGYRFAITFANIGTFGTLRPREIY